MDEVLSRILSLIPKKENGDFKHGAKAEFCKSIRIKPQTLSDWISGRSTSYKDKVYQISSVYDVPVEWIETGKERFKQNYEAAKKAEEDDTVAVRERLRSSPELKILFDAAENAPASALLEAAAIIMRYKEQSK